LAIGVGSILRGKYRLDALIGRGGMGHVFAATDLESTAAVAVKVVSRVFFDDVLMARLHREAEAAAIIRSDYVPRVLEVSETDEREVFLVMERLVGEPLSAHMRQKGPLSWSEVSKLGEDILRGLIDAHTAGIVHRDLKPSNVFLSVKRGVVRAMILDFGVCKIDVNDAERLTGTGESIGTVAYMAPEQIRGASKVDDRADLYAFGAVVFEMLCGRLPHEGPSQMAILASKLENEASRLRDHAQVEVPAGLDDLLAKTLSRDSAGRPASAQDLLKAWRGLMTSGLIVPTPGAGIVPTRMEDAPTVHSAPAPEGIAPPRSSNPMVPEPMATQNAVTTGATIERGRGGARLAIALAACGLVAGFAGVAAFFARSPSSAPSTPAAEPASADPPADSAEPPITTVWEVPSGSAASSDPGPGDPGPATSSGRRPTPRIRTARPAPPPPPPQSTKPHITEKPRF
jgi:serine/threonine-protein kinase